ncbi:MAG: SEFIR domain-containing protein, partial [Prosthecobacter sp.]
MPEVFISYRQTSDTERQRVRAFAEQIRSSGISVILDQFFLEDHPGGPNEGWDKWSSDRALHTSHVIIIGSESWFQCFDKTQAPGTGLGAACEADDIRHRVYEANGIVETIRVVLFDDADANHISAKLKRYHRFHADRDFDNIVRWLRDTQKAEMAVECGQQNKSKVPHSTATILLPSSS